MAEHTHGSGHPDKGWSVSGWYRCLGFGCGWCGRPHQGTMCRVCGTAVPPKSMTQERWHREVYDAGLYQPATEVPA